jgi:ribose 5-phosphate isomerase A
MAGSADQTIEMSKRQVAAQAANLVEDGMVVGLGSGSTAALMVQALGERVRNGLRIIGVPTSEATAGLARSLNIPLATLEDQPRLDLDIDGADEVDPLFNLTKGLGGALLREKIVATAASRLAIIVDAGKLVEQLGSHAPLPVEIIPFGWRATQQALAQLGATPALRTQGDAPFVTDGSHYILDCRFPPGTDLPALAPAIKALTGVVDHGLFLGMASLVIVGYPDHVETLHPS